MIYLLLPLAFYLLLLGLRYLLTFLQLQKTAIQFPEYWLLSASAVPAYLQPLLQTPVRELTGYGFKPCSYLQTKAFLKLEPTTSVDLLLYHPGRKTYAILTLRLMAEPANLFDVEFYSFFRDQSLLITLNGKAFGLLADIPQTTVQDAYTADLATQWQRHQDCLERSDQVVAPAPERFIAALQRRLHKYIEQMAQTGILVKADPGEYRLTKRAALRQTFKNVHANRKVTQLLQQQRQQAKADAARQVEIPVELEVRSYQRMEAWRRDIVGNKFRTWMLLISLGAFIAAYTQTFTSQSFLIFMGALVLHEGGHLLAMRLFGYRDTALLFLPFLGAVATAQRKDASLSQKFWISLAGPLPGLGLGIGLMVLNRQFGLEALVGTPWGIEPNLLFEISSILISLNLFNLLPIYPLDGGQIADLLLFSRFPYLGVGFKSLGVLMLGLIGLTQPMLIGFAVLIACGIPNSFRTAKLTTRLRKELRNLQPLQANHSQANHLEPDQALSPADEQALQLIFEGIKQQGHGNLPFTQRHTLAKHLLHSRHELRAKWPTRLGLSLIYSLSLVGGIIGTVYAFLPNLGEALLYRVNHQRQVEGQIEQASAALQINPDDIAAYKQRAEARSRINDYQGALADYDQILQRRPNDTEARLARAMYRSIEGDEANAIQDYSYVLQRDPKNLKALQSRAQEYWVLDKLQPALADYNALIKLSPSDPLLYLDRGDLRLELKDYKGAIADANAALAVKPNYPSAYALRSKARRSLGDIKGAETDQQKANQLYETWEED